MLNLDEKHNSRFTIPGASRWCFEVVLNVCFPPSCCLCGRRIFEIGGICPRCWQSISFISKPYCDRLGTPFSFDLGPNAVSAEAIANPPDFDRARAAVLYDERSKRLVHGLKYQDRDAPLGFVTSVMAQAGRDLITDDTLLIPVPLHAKRLWKRRFNQSQRLAQGISEKSGCEVFSQGLVRVRNTKQQVGLTEKQRETNVRGAFRVPEAAMAKLFEANVILVDDVLTSGATLNACARALRRAGVKTVDVLVFARVADPEQSNI